MQTTETHNVGAAEVCRQWDQILAEVSEQRARVLVEQNGVAVAALVSADDLLRLQQWDEERRHAYEVLERFSAPFKDEPPEETERQVALAIEESRADAGQRAVDSQ